MGTTMDDKTAELLEKFDDLLESVQPKQFALDSYVGITVLPHIKWMIGQAKSKGDKWDQRKMDVWMGFIQGVLWSRDYYSIKELRELAGSVSV